jgi:restriction endonuclease S subunit
MDSFYFDLPDDNTARIDVLFNNPFLIKKIKEIKATLSRKDNMHTTLSPYIAKVSGGKRLPKGTVITALENATIPYIGATDVKDGRVDFENCKKITPELYKDIKKFNLNNGDAAIVIVGVNVGEAGVVESELQENAFSENVARIRKNDDNLSAEFLSYLINSEYCRLQTIRVASGSSQPKLSLKNCRDLNIILPQKNDTFDVDREREILAKVWEIEKIRRQKQSEAKQIMAEMQEKVQDELGLGKIPPDSQYNIYSSDLDLERVDVLFNSPFRFKLLEIIEKKDHDKLRRLVEIQEKGKILPSSFYKLIELDDIDELFGEVRNIKDVRMLESDKVVFRTSEILVSKLEPQKGKVLIVNDKTDGCVGSSELIPLQLSSEKILREYLWAVLRTPYILKQWEYSIRGCSRERIGDEELLETIIPIPDKKIQEKIVSIAVSSSQNAKKLLEESEELGKKAKAVFLRELT